MTRDRPLIIGFWAALSVLVGTRAAAAEPSSFSCVDRLMASRSLGPGWASAVAELEQTLRGMSSSECLDASLRIRAVSGGVLLEATTVEGGHAARRIVEPSLLVPVALGLLARAPELSLPVPELGAPRTSASELDLLSPEPWEPEDAARSARDASLDFDERSAVASAPPALRAHRFNVDLGLDVGSRVSFSNARPMLDVAGHGDFVSGDWLVRVAARRASTWLLDPDAPDTYRETAVSVGLGRRVRLGPNFLALVVSPLFTSVLSARDASSDDARAHSEAQLRVAASATYSFALSKGLRLDAMLDADAAIGVLDESWDPGAPRYALPRASVGLLVGAAGDLL